MQCPQCDEAIRVAGEAVEFVVPPLLTRAGLFLHRGRFEAALDTARYTQRAAREYVAWRIEARRIEAEALLELGPADDGQRLLRHVKADARALGVVPSVWQACLALADCLTAEGRDDESSVERAEALAELDRVAADLPEHLRRSFPSTIPMRRAREG